VELTIRTATYRVEPPRARNNREGVGRPIHVVCAREENPPEGVEAVEWILLTSEPVAKPEDALLVLEHYTARWVIEEWHKALKTGCRIESRQLEEWHRLEVLLAIYSVIAWRLVALRDAARCGEELRAGVVLTESEMAILTRLDRTLRRSVMARDYLVSIAKLGGFLGRKGDGDPGWMTLWMGYSRLLDMQAGYELAKQR
jgi:hypothetical protein